MFVSSNFVFLLFENVRREYTYSLVYIKIARLKFMVSLQSIIWVFLLNNFSRVINLLLTKLTRDRTGRISALGLLLYGPRCARSVLSRPRADILPVQP